MCPDKLLHRGVSDKINAELRAILLEQRAHHTLEQRGQTLAHVIAEGAEHTHVQTIEH